MRKLIIVALCVLFANNLLAQPWLKELKKIRHEKGGEMTLQDFQGAFYKYWDKQDVKLGYFHVDGVRKKAPGWKQFKRWEWYWGMNTNPLTGKFPGKSVAIEFRKYREQRTKADPLGNWTIMGPEQTTGGYAGLGRINTIAFHPDNDEVMWVGSPSGGIWQTTDGGASWTVLNDFNDVLGVSDIAVSDNYAVDQTLYIATGDRDGGSLWSLGGGVNADNQSVGILKSTDGGLNWQPTGLSYTTAERMLIGRLLMHPTDNNTLLAGTSEGIFKTTDGGVSWNKVFSNGDYVIDMEFNTADPSIIYATTIDYTYQSRILRSADLGETWTSVHSTSYDEYRVELAVTDDNADVVYAVSALYDGSMGYIYRSDDGGVTFSSVFDGTVSGKNLLGYYSDGSGRDGQGSYDLAIAVSPTDYNTLFVGGVNTWKSIDGGSNWSINNMWTGYGGYNYSSAPVVHADKHVLRYNGATLFEGNDGGIYESVDDGNTWTDLSNNLQISQMYRLGVAATDNDVVITGLQDNGSKLYETGEWRDVTGGDGMECLIDYTNPSIQYATYANGTLYRTTDSWRGSATTISDNIYGETGYWVTPFTLHPTDPKTLFVGYTNVWKSTNRGDSFIKISNFPGKKITSLVVAASNPDWLYISDGSTLWRTQNGGTNWSNLSGNLPVSSNTITSLLIDDKNPEQIWLTVGGFDAGRIFVSYDGGETWDNISGGLPNIPAYTVVKDTSIHGQPILYMGMERGVYVKIGEETWAPYSGGLPNVVVTELDIYYDNNPDNSRIRAASFGRGLWQSPLFRHTKEAYIASDESVGSKFCAAHVQTLTYAFVNEGQETLTSANFVAEFVNAGKKISQQWTGNLEPNQSAQIIFENLNFEAGEEQLKVYLENPNGSVDQFPGNDTVVYDYHLFNEALFPYSQHFSELIMPSCWSEEVIVSNGGIWRFNNPLNRDFYSSTGGDGFAILDNEFESGSETNSCLFTPLFDFSGYSQVTVHFEYLFHQDVNGQVAFSVSTDGGGSWEQLEAWTASSANAATFEEIYTSIALQDSVMFKWCYTGQDNSYFAFDDFAISGISTDEPVIIAKYPTDITFSSARMEGTANANGVNLGKVKFYLGESSGNYTSIFNATPDTVFAEGNTPLYALVDTLKQMQTYYYKIKGTNELGVSFESNEQSFSTLNVELGQLSVNGDPFYVSSTKTDTVSVTLAMKGEFLEGNEFQLWLSDVDGDFANGRRIFRKAAKSLSEMEGVIPVSTVSGTAYTLKVKTTLPAIESNSSENIQIVFDNVAPKVDIRFLNANPTGEEVIDFEIYADEPVFGLELDNISVNNGEMIAFSKASETLYQGQIHASAEGTVVLTVPQGSVQDRAQNINAEVTASIVYDEDTSIDLIEELGLRIYPNPADDYFEITMKQGLDGTVFLLDERGQTLSLVHLSKSQSSYLIPMYEYSSGIYFVKIVSSNMEFVKKIIKQ